MNKTTKSKISLFNISSHVKNNNLNKTTTDFYSKLNNKYSYNKTNFKNKLSSKNLKICLRKKNKLDLKGKSKISKPIIDENTNYKTIKYLKFDKFQFQNNFINKNLKINKSCSKPSSINSKNSYYSNKFWKSYYNNYDWMVKKNKKVQQMKNDKKKKELENCSFKPKINYIKNKKLSKYDINIKLIKNTKTYILIDKNKIYNRFKETDSIFNNNWNYKKIYNKILSNN